MGFILKIFKRFEGYKAILGYLIAQLAGSQPLLMAAWIAWLANKHDPQAIADLVAQLALAGGLLHKFIRNIKSYLS